MTSVITGLIIFAEISFYIGITLLGKPLLIKIKYHLINRLPTQVKDKIKGEIKDKTNPKQKIIKDK